MRNHQHRNTIDKSNRGFLWHHLEYILITVNKFDIILASERIYNGRKVGIFS